MPFLRSSTWSSGCRGPRGSPSLSPSRTPTEVAPQDQRGSGVVPSSRGQQQVRNAVQPRLGKRTTSCIGDGCRPPCSDYCATPGDKLG